MILRSVYYDQQDILAAIRALHAPAGFDCDITFGKGSFYKNGDVPKLRFDIDPQDEITVKASSDALPIESGSLQSMVFDPPFLTYVKAARNHDCILAKRFGGYWRYDELEAHYRATLSEVRRCLAKNGVLIFKCQDIIHNHTMHCTHARVIGWAQFHGLELIDLYVLPATNRMPIPPQEGMAPKRQKHARIFHSYFLVFQKIQ